MNIIYLSTRFEGVNLLLALSYKKHYYLNSSCEHSDQCYKGLHLAPLQSQRRLDLGPYWKKLQKEQRPGTEYQRRSSNTPNSSLSNHPSNTLRWKAPLGAGWEKRYIKNLEQRKHAQGFSGYMVSRLLSHLSAWDVCFYPFILYAGMCTWILSVFGEAHTLLSWLFSFFLSFSLPFIRISK